MCMGFIHMLIICRNVFTLHTLTRLLAHARTGSGTNSQDARARTRTFQPKNISHSEFGETTRHSLTHFVRVLDAFVWPFSARCCYLFNLEPFDRRATGRIRLQCAPANGNLRLTCIAEWWWWWWCRLIRLISILCVFVAPVAPHSVMWITKTKRKKKKNFFLSFSSVRSITHNEIALCACLCIFAGSQAPIHRVCIFLGAQKQFIEF